jgi:hypothetical protein
MGTDINLQNSIIAALSHPEAEDGLYFRNFFTLHQEDDRPKVDAPKESILKALNTLIKSGKVKVDFDDLETTFKLA